MIATFLVLFVALAAAQVLLVFKLADRIDDTTSVGAQARPAHAGPFAHVA